MLNVLNICNHTGFSVCWWYKLFRMYDVVVILLNAGVSCSENQNHFGYCSDSTEAVIQILIICKWNINRHCPRKNVGQSYGDDKTPFISILINVLLVCTNWQSYHLNIYTYHRMIKSHNSSLFLKCCIPT